MNKPQIRDVLNSNRGSVFLQAIMVLIVMGIVFYTITPVVIKHRIQSTKSFNIVKARLAMHSMIDYTLVGVRQKWCFSPSWIQEPCGSDKSSLSNVMTHPRSVERVIIGDDALGYIKETTTLDITKIMLDDFSQTLKISDISALHPVYKIVKDMNLSDIQKMRVQISRNQNASLPQYGYETYLRVAVSLLDSQDKVVKIGGSQLLTESFVGVYPREVGSFALLVAGDLYLNKKTATGMKAGDAFFKQFDSRNVFQKEDGLNFSSPVYVNGNIELPAPSTMAQDLAGADTAYTPVTFKSKVYIGSGGINRNGKPFVPRALGHVNDQFWNQIRQFGGFKGGVEVDGIRDIGLDFLSGYATSATPEIAEDKTLMNVCIGQNEKKFDLVATETSDLVANYNKQKSSSNTFNYMMKLTDMNSFLVQDGTVGAPKFNNDSFGDGLKVLSNSIDLENKNKGSVFGFEMQIGSLVVKGQVPENGSVEFEMKPKLTAYKDSLQGAVSKSQQEISGLENEVGNLANKIKDNKNKILSLQQDLQSAKTNEEKNEINADIAKANSNIASAQSSIAQKKTEIESKMVSGGTVQNQIDMATLSESKVSKIEISVTKPRGDSGNNSYRELEVQVKNELGIVTAKNEPANIRFILEAFDVSYNRGSSNRSPDINKKQKNVGLLEITRSGTALVKPTAFADLSGKSREVADAELSDIGINYDDACKTPEVKAFANVDWEQSFAPNSKISWSFTNTYADRTNYIFNLYNAATTGGRVPAFSVISMAKDCIIESTANFVTGFFTCERLVILPRTNPLRIIGSFIVVNGITIDDSAYRAGIEWSSIYHPVATYELRRAGVLKGLAGTSCEARSVTPVWHPYPAIRDVANLNMCNAVSLREKADNFRWTSVDPDCGLQGVSSNSTICKNRVVNYYVLEVSRDSGI